MRLALDPGPVVTGWCLLGPDGVPVQADVSPNERVIEMLRAGGLGARLLVIERIESRGMSVAQVVFDTCVWIGRFQQAWHDPEAARLIFRRVVKLHLCGSVKASDANVWQALLDRFGGKDVAVGKKAAPGRLYGVKSHARQALAVAITDFDNP